MSELIACPACANPCSVAAATCPKCGHPFPKQKRSSSTAEQKRPPNLFKYLTFAAGILGVTLLVVVGLRLERLGILSFRNADSPNSNTKASAKSDDNSRPSNASPSYQIAPIDTPTPTGTINLETGIEYKMGGVQPVSRTEFQLLDSDLNSILAEAGLNAKDQSGLDRIAQFGLAAKYPEQSGGAIARCLKAIKKHSRYSTTTDFQGKAKFAGVNVGTYYLFGYTETRGGFAVWSLPTKVGTGESTVYLDVSNAATAL